MRGVVTWWHAKKSSAVQGRPPVRAVSAALDGACAVTLAILFLRWPVDRLACNADHIVSIDAGTGSRRVTAGVGDVVDIRLWAGALGMYGNQPTISTPALSFGCRSGKIDVNRAGSGNQHPII